MSAMPTPKPARTLEDFANDPQHGDPWLFTDGDYVQCRGMYAYEYQGTDYVKYRTGTGSYSSASLTYWRSWILGTDAKPLGNQKFPPAQVIPTDVLPVVKMLRKGLGPRALFLASCAFLLDVAEAFDDTNLHAEAEQLLMVCALAWDRLGEEQWTDLQFAVKTQRMRVRKQRRRLADIPVPQPPALARICDC